MQEPKSKAISYKHVLTQDGQRSEFRPQEAVAALAIIWAAGGSSTVFIYVAVYFFRRANDASANVWIGAIFLLAAVIFVVAGVWAWGTRRTPLTVERDGRVCYGKRQWCAAGMVRSVRIASARSGESGDCQVYLEVDGSELLSLPSLWFGSVRERAHARPLAEALAKALGVGITESD